MKKQGFWLGLVLVGCFFALAACCHTYDLDVQGHKLTQVRTWDLIGPSTVGFYESRDGKLFVYQNAAGSNIGAIATGIGAGYAGERIGDGLKNQEPDSTNVRNELSSSSNSKGATALAAGGSAGATAAAVANPVNVANARAASRSAAGAASVSNAAARSDADAGAVSSSR
jgi:hypothetical protein